METIQKAEKPAGPKDARPGSNQKPKKKILMTQVKHPLLKVKEIMNTVLQEGDNLPAQVRKEIARVRDTAWRLFVEEQEKLDSNVQ
jgi:hypothetical protein